MAIGDMRPIALARTNGLLAVLKQHWVRGTLHHLPLSGPPPETGR